MSDAALKLMYVLLQAVKTQVAVSLDLIYPGMEDRTREFVQQIIVKLFLKQFLITLALM